MPRSLAPLLEPFRPVGLETVNASAALGDRVDVKYIVGLDVLAALADSLLPTHHVLEIAGRRRFDYRTIYFDSADLLTYRHHVQGRRRRFKCRAREYVDSGLRTFEVKLKGCAGRTVKHRTALAGGPIDRLDAPLLDFVSGHLRDAYAWPDAPAFQPTLDMRFTRITLVDLARAERLTCDLQLGFTAPDGVAGRLVAGAAIVESKSRSGVASADRALRELGARPIVGCSKYCLGVGQTYANVRSNTFRPLLRRYFEPAVGAHAVLAAV